MKWMVWLCCAACVGCSAAEEGPQTGAPEAAVTRAQGQPLAGPAVDRLPEAGAARTPELDVAPEVAAQLAPVRIPMLLPRTAAHRGDLFVTQGPTWASAAMRGDGLHLSILARTRAEVRPHLAAQMPACEGECIRTSSSDAIFSVAFFRYGVAYLLNVECDRAAADPRCSDESFALGVYDDLAFAGGGQ